MARSVFVPALLTLLALALLPVSTAGADTVHLKNGGKLLSDALEEYRKVLMPFLSAAEKSKEVDQKALLEHWVGKRAFKVRPLNPFGSDHQKVVSKLRKGAERVRAAERLRRRRPHRRI